MTHAIWCTYLRIFACCSPGCIWKSWKKRFSFLLILFCVSCACIRMIWQISWWKNTPNSQLKQVHPTHRNASMHTHEYVSRVCSQTCGEANKHTLTTQTVLSEHHLSQHFSYGDAANDFCPSPKKKQDFSSRPHITLKRERFEPFPFCLYSDFFWNDICMYVCVRACVCVHACIYLYVHMQTRTHSRKYAYTPIHTQPHTQEKRKQYFHQGQLVYEWDQSLDEVLPFFFPVELYERDKSFHVGLYCILCSTLYVCFCTNRKRKMGIIDCSTLWHCNILQHAAAHYNTLQHAEERKGETTEKKKGNHWLQHTATHCNTLQHTATHCNTLQHTAAQRGDESGDNGKEEWESLTATHCSTLQHAATHSVTQRPESWRERKRRIGIIDCNTLQITATNHNLLQHNAPLCPQKSLVLFPAKEPVICGKCCFVLLWLESYGIQSYRHPVW